MGILDGESVSIIESSFSNLYGGLTNVENTEVVSNIVKIENLDNIWFDNVRYHNCDSMSFKGISISQSKNIRV